MCSEFHWKNPRTFFPAFPTIKLHSEENSLLRVTHSSSVKWKQAVAFILYKTTYIQRNIVFINAHVCLSICVCARVCVINENWRESLAAKRPSHQNPSNYRCSCIRKYATSSYMFCALMYMQLTNLAVFTYSVGNFFLSVTIELRNKPL